MTKNNRIIAIIPAFNEEGKVGKVVSGIVKEKVVDEVLVIDDGSSDNTVDEAVLAGAKIIRHKHNQGVGAALQTGFEYALNKDFGIILIMGADDQDNPSEMKRVLRPITEDSFDFVQGSRYMAGGERINIPAFRWITTGFYSFVFKVLVRFPVSDGTNGFRAFRTNILKNNKINWRQRWLKKYELEPYLYYKAIECNFRITDSPVTKKYPLDKIGYTKMVPFFDWWSILKPIIYLKIGLRK